MSDVVEVARAARDESGVTFVHLNAGFQGSRGVQFAEPYIAALKELGVLVGAQLAGKNLLLIAPKPVRLKVDCLEFVICFEPGFFHHNLDVLELQALTFL